MRFHAFFKFKYEPFLQKLKETALKWTELTYSRSVDKPPDPAAVG